MNKGDASSSSKAMGEVSARGIPLQATHQEAFEAALEEVREVMVQYTQCADPTESAARRERMKKAEQQGELEETALQMVKAAMIGTETEQEVTLGLRSSPTAERIPAALRLGPLNTEDTLCREEPPRDEAAPKRKPGRPPALHRLGPSKQQRKPNNEDTTNEKQSERKKLGRPPGKRVVHQSPKPIRGTSSRKRKVQRDNTTSCRKKLNADTTKATSSKNSDGLSGATTSSENQPICKMIPAKTRK